MRLRHTTLPLALASAVSLGAQLLFGLLLLGWFTPQAVGEFSVISQLAFFWMTLALAQAPLTLLADLREPPVAALGRVLRASLWRLLLLTPLAALALHVGAPDSGWQLLPWLALLALLQVGSNLAPSFHLRLNAARAAAAGRALPPVVALLAAGLLSVGWSGAGATTLLLAAALGYACGALWLLPAVTGAPRAVEPPVARPAQQGDDRSTALRLAHTAADALTAAALLLLWQRTHGVAEAGLLAVLLRLLGFVPTVIHVAWAQVLLTQGGARRAGSWVAGLAGTLVTVLLGAACLLALHMQWLGPAWSGLSLLVVPVVLWQASACWLAAYSHLPFQQGRSRGFSWLAMGFDALQLAVLGLPLVWGWPVSAQTHLWWLSALSCVGLLGLLGWSLRNGRQRA